MRVVIIGQKWLAVQLLQLCQSRGDDIASVIVPSAQDSLAKAARQDGIVATVGSRYITAKHLPPDVDVILCAHNHSFISASAREHARFGALGYHPSLLPRHRGRDSIRWALHMGDKTTGGTVYWLDDGADKGAIAAQDWCWIRPNDSETSLWRDTLAPMGVQLFAEVLNQLDDGKAPSRAQDESLATFEPSFSKSKLKPSPVE